MTSPVRALWDAPAAYPPPPHRVWRDWVLVGVFAPLAVVEAFARAEVPWRWLWAALLVALVPTLLFRRVRPLAVLAIAFGISMLATLVTGGQPELFTSAYFLILVYAVMRWGTGRAMVIGGAILLAGVLVSFLTTSPTLADVIGGIAVVVATSTLGVTFRWRAAARARELETMRLREREQLARDLHDTVAHHVSAIAIQAQAGTAVAPDDPAAAAAVLGVIEGEAARTLDEMRAMVRLLRHADTSAERMPTPGVADITSLAHPEGTPVVDVEIAGDAAIVPPAVGAALFRIAQEAVTNARRHARGATRVAVTVRAEPEEVRLDVRDDGHRDGGGDGDGDGARAASVRSGYGIAGMTERAALLGGTCAAGPATEGGWVVTATLPCRSGAA